MVLARSVAARFPGATLWLLAFLRVPLSTWTSGSAKVAKGGGATLWLLAFLQVSPSTWTSGSTKVGAIVAIVGDGHGWC